MRWLDFWFEIDYILLEPKSNTMKQRLFQYAVLWHPNEAEAKEGKKSEILVQPKIVLAADQNGAQLSAAMDIPAKYKATLEQVEVAVRPF